MLQRLPLILLFSLLCVFSSAQYKLYEDTFAGGVVTGGYSNGATVPSGSGSFNVAIPAGSTIRRAYLIAGRVGSAPDVTVTLNGSPFTFSAANVVTTGFTTIYGGVSGVHAIDITASISPATSAYTIAVPVQNTVSDKYPEFYLYIAFNNSSYPAVTSAIFFNTFTASSSYPWVLNVTTPVLNTSPVGLGILGGYAAIGSDCENVNVNGTAIGNFGGPDFNSSSGWGTMSGFQYYSSTLTGYNDDNANQPMNLADALSNIQALIPASTTSIPVTFTHCGGGSDNHVWAVFLTHSGGTVLDQGLGPVNALPTAEGIAVHWQTNSLTGDENLFVERSADLQHFEVVASSPAQTGAAQYSQLDPRPIPGMSWYRVRAVDAQGATTVSEAVQVGMQSAAWTIFPQPVVAGDWLEVQGVCQTGPLTYSVHSLTGAELVAQGTATDGKIPTSGISPGVYHLQLQGCGEMLHTKLVVR
jgi:hypothetical protein